MRSLTPPWRAGRSPQVPEKPRRGCRPEGRLRARTTKQNGGSVQPAPRAMSAPHRPVHAASARHNVLVWPRAAQRARLCASRRAARPPREGAPPEVLAKAARRSLPARYAAVASLATPHPAPNCAECPRFAILRAAGGRFKRRPLRGSATHPSIVNVDSLRFPPHFAPANRGVPRVSLAALPLKRAAGAQ